MNSKNKIKHITKCGLFAALICILSPLSVPVGVIPVTLGLFAVLLTANTLNSVCALSSVAVYILIGACGLPVFSSGNAGIGVLTGPTGGYIWAYPVVAFLLPLLRKLNRVRRNRILKTGIDVLFNIISVAVLYLMGTLWFSFVSGNNFWYSVTICVVPFIAFDTVKIIVAVILSERIKKHI